MNSTLHTCPLRLWEHVKEFEAFELLTHKLEMTGDKHIDIDNFQSIFFSQLIFPVNVYHDYNNLDTMKRLLLKVAFRILFTSV